AVLSATAHLHPRAHLPPARMLEVRPARVGVGGAAARRRVVGVRGVRFTGVADAVLSEGFVNHNPAFGHPPTREGYTQTVAQFRAAFPDFVMAVEDLIADGDTVAVRWRATIAPPAP